MNPDNSSLAPIDPTQASARDSIAEGKRLSSVLGAQPARASLRRSAQVSAPLLASAALALLTTGCRPSQPKRCVDDKNHVVDPSFCEVQNQDPNNPLYRGSGWPYHYYYGGYGGFAPGTFVSGGSTSPADGVSYSTTTRGGFGSSFGGGDGSGGGHGGGGGE